MLCFLGAAVLRLRGLVKVILTLRLCPKAPGSPLANHPVFQAP